MVSTSSVSYLTMYKQDVTGRLAMVAIIGLIVQNLLFDGKPSL